MSLTLVFTAHARTVMAERDIQDDWVQRAVDTPDKVEADPSGTGVLRYFRRVPERGGRVLRVAGYPDAGTVRVVTVFFDRGAKL